jgi:hypothetical protein
MWESGNSMLLMDLPVGYINNQLLLKIQQWKIGFRCSLAYFTQGTCSRLPSCCSQRWKSHFEVPNINHSRTTVETAQELRFPRMLPDFSTLAAETHVHREELTLFRSRRDLSNLVQWNKRLRNCFFRNLSLDCTSKPRSLLRVLIRFGTRRFPIVRMSSLFPCFPYKMTH